MVVSVKVGLAEGYRRHGAVGAVCVERRGWILAARLPSTKHAGPGSMGGRVGGSRMRGGRMCLKDNMKYMNNNITIMRWWVGSGSSASIIIITISTIK